jgi:CMP-N-acetylneuraminic acid synthetase
MHATAFIFARKGSKGLPGKNIKLFHGKPLIAWAIEQAQKAKKINRVIVSTDSQEISEIALSYGAEVPFLRPKNLSEDSSPERKAWQHALNFLLEEEGKLPDIMISVPATSPLREPSDLDACIEEYLNSEVDTLLTVMEAARNPYFTMLSKDENTGLFDLAFKSEKQIIRRQDAPKIFDIASIAWVTDPNFVLSNDNLYDGRVGAIEVPAERAIDIDTMLDFKIAELLFHEKHQSQS